MNTRELGHTGLQVKPLMFGGNVFGWTADEDRSFALLDAFVEAGFNFIDTADVYSHWVPGHQGGESETILGKWFQRTGKRDRVILATKVGSDMGHGNVGLAGAYIKKAVDASLQRLQTDYIDLYQSHKDDLKTPQEETLQAYTELIKAGKVRAIGASNFTAERLTSAMEISEKNGLAAYQTLQPQYNLVERRDYEQNLAPVCKKYGLGVVPYFSLAAGFLTGKYRSDADVQGKQRAGMVKKYVNDRGLAVLKALDEVAQETNSTPTSVSLAWLLTKPNLLAPIASATSLEQLPDLLKSVDLPLSPEAIQKLDAASASFA